MTMQLRLSDEQWQQVMRQLPGILGVRAQRDVQRYRTFIDEVLWVVGNDLVWHELQPATCGWRSVYMRFQRWGDAGVWAIVLRVIEDNPMLCEALQRRLDEQQRSRERRLRRAPAFVPSPTAAMTPADVQPVPLRAQSDDDDAAVRPLPGGPKLTLGSAGSWARGAELDVMRRRA
ncbi:transposase [Stenotrophomonas maltophilia]|jgi:hypothetical protein|uniref:transposase n=1 Tax=Stenotrophomonas maltophilia TaxID=40324 RepID=UPI00145BF460|nr:transposase [Stenotrophomonas maltophilia]